jgi:zinc transporter 1
MILLAIDTAFFFLELVVGYAVHSLALVADSFHMLNDVISLLVGLWAVKVASQRTNSKTYTYGVSILRLVYLDRLLTAGSGNVRKP